MDAVYADDPAQAKRSTQINESTRNSNLCYHKFRKIHDPPVAGVVRCARRPPFHARNVRARVSVCHAGMHKRSIIVRQGYSTYATTEARDIIFAHERMRLRIPHVIQARILFSVECARQEKQRESERQSERETSDTFTYFRIILHIVQHILYAHGLPEPIAFGFSRLACWLAGWLAVVPIIYDSIKQHKSQFKPNRFRQTF